MYFKTDLRARTVKTILWIAKKHHVLLEQHALIYQADFIVNALSI